MLDLSVDQSMSLTLLRGRIAATLVDLDRALVQAVLFVATELVTNVHDHAPGPCQVRVSPSADGIRVEVDDGSPELPVVGRSRLGVDGGGGWLLISRMCHAWGADPLPAGGKTVWAVIPALAAGGTGPG